MNTKRTFSILLATILVLSMMATGVLASDFTDVEKDAYYSDAVYWAVENGITNGVGNNKFAPNDTCTRAQIVTFLWRAENQPEPINTTNPFVDVKSSDYFYKAVLWAVENGITTGTGATTFSPNDNCTRAQAVTFLWRSNGSKDSSNIANQFVDVDINSYYAKAVSWAVENGITNGTSETTFSPDSPCNRAQIVTFLYRTEHPYSDDEDFTSSQNGIILINSNDLTINTTATINITAYTDDITVSYDGNVIETEWGEWNNDDIPLYIYPVRNGTSPLTIYDTNNPQESVTIYITVYGLESGNSSSLTINGIGEEFESSYGVHKIEDATYTIISDDTDDSINIFIEVLASMQESTSRYTYIQIDYQLFDSRNVCVETGFIWIDISHLYQLYSYEIEFHGLKPDNYTLQFRDSYY